MGGQSVQQVLNNKQWVCIDDTDVDGVHKSHFLEVISSQDDEGPGPGSFGGSGGPGWLQGASNCFTISVKHVRTKSAISCFRHSLLGVQAFTRLAQMLEILFKIDPSF